MNRTKNELADYAWNPVTGCLKDCRYCYARKSTLRFASDWRRNLAERPKVQQVGEKLFELDTPWAGKIQAAFPQSFVNMQNELIFSLRTDSGFSLKDVTDETQLKAKILEWLTRTAIKAVSPKERKLHFEGINKLLGTNFTLEEMTDIYTYLGNGINHDLCVKFVESGYDMTMIQKEG